MNTARSQPSPYHKMDPLQGDPHRETSNGVKKRLLLHICCAPDATIAVERLSRDYDITAYFYDPNIHPEEEYSLRLSEMKRLAMELSLPLRWGDYDADRWLETMKGLEDIPEGGERCESCFRFRLDGAAAYARDNGFHVFSTVLTVSPHKDAEIINRIGSDMGTRHGIEFLPLNLKKKRGFERSVALSKHYKLYRQNYCGCLYSKPRKKEDHGHTGKNSGSPEKCL